jgi:hypothetical protein
MGTTRRRVDLENEIQGFATPNKKRQELMLPRLLKFLWKNIRPGQTSEDLPTQECWLILMHLRRDRRRVCGNRRRRFVEASVL